MPTTPPPPSITSRVLAVQQAVRDGRLKTSSATRRDAVTHFPRRAGADGSGVSK